MRRALSWYTLMRRVFTTGFFLLCAGCLNVEDPSGISLDFNFNVTGEGFTSGAADYPAAQASAVGAVGDLRLLPGPSTSTTKGLYLSGTTVGGDLFLFHKRRFTCLAPNSTYQAQISIGYMTDYHAGCTGGAGPLTFLKAGVGATEPLTSVNAQGVVVMNIDKGAGTARGLFVQLGDIRNGQPLCPSVGIFAERATLAQTQSATLVTDAEGAFWLFIGTQSSFPGTHQIYITGLRLTLR